MGVKVNHACSLLCGFWHTAGHNRVPDTIALGLAMADLGTATESPDGLDWVEAEHNHKLGHFGEAVLDGSPLDLGPKKAFLAVWNSTLRPKTSVNPQGSVKNHVSGKSRFRTFVGP